MPRRFGPCQGQQGWERGRAVPWAAVTLRGKLLLWGILLGAGQTSLLETEEAERNQVCLWRDQAPPDPPGTGKGWSEEGRSAWGICFPAAALENGTGGQRGREKSSWARAVQ